MSSVEIKFHLEVWRSETGRWYVASPELKGLLVSEATMKEALVETPDVIAALWECLCNEQADGTLKPAGAEQMAAYAPIFAKPK